MIKFLKILGILCAFALSGCGDIRQRECEAQIVFIKIEDLGNRTETTITDANGDLIYWTSWTR